MEKLIEMLGEDGLDEFDQVQLSALGGEDEDEWESDEEGEGGQKQGDSEEEVVEIEGEEGESDKNEGEGDEESEEEVEVEEDSEKENRPADEKNVKEDDGVALDDLEDVSVDEDAVPTQKVEVDNKLALERIRNLIQLDPSLPWTETLAVTYPESIDVDVNDDLNRELAFYKQALHSADAARALASKNKLPFTRPSDYFAEMVKSDSHMERIRQRLLDESAGIKKSEDKRKEREGKKFGKQVQMEKLKERGKNKKDMEDRIQNLKRKRKGALDNAQADGDAFDVAVEDAITDRPAKRSKGPGGKNISRQSRDQKFGFGGKGRRSKQNTKASTDNFDAGSAGRRGHGATRGGPGGSRGGGNKRLGKSRRMTARSKK
ncbi:hypothetical protein SERLA73DRAFT_189171 [Serpula lacrymans var. lacrymans S7.3]|uniref:Ebp2-domain-containing protein n=1 Tax=Serpula lacrymans var. lacrymans (strain S7.3) TaxID=936435 RepID=F8QD06_SERL3|nr:hypothetical protein SERLA73DRAFT_189171 [Serpula lacrymans var. lacrymans S7.3]